MLALPDDELIAALAGRRRPGIERELCRLDVGALRARASVAGLGLICRCDPAYPAQLRSLDAPPAVLHVAGSLERALALLERDSVAIVGARRASGYGLDVARSLARGLATAGLTVISGMALGIDSAAHAGTLAAHGATVAVLPGGADRPYPASRRPLYRRIVATGTILSELPAGAAVRRWAPPARNRLIAALAAVTVVVEAGARSGALVTASYARELGHPVGAVPGRVTSDLAAGCNGLIRSGAALIRRPQDVLDELFGEGVVTYREAVRPPLREELERLLCAVGKGHDTIAALGQSGFSPEQALAGISELELCGYVRRGPGGRFSVVP
ncbi:MAG: DNA-protecting protein DprA [Solirubrobacterales bacterium]|nr:DNA-protecting protein DprA [Solirubrobacterales bacterium]